MDLELKLDSLIGSIELLLSNKLHGPSLILIYSTIDILAWLGRCEEHADVKRSDFLSWADTYLIPFLGDTVTSLDLYSARCSILHSYTAESRLSRNHQAQEIYYAFGTARSEDLQEIIDSSDRKAIAIQTENLFEGLRKGTHIFLEDFPDENLLSERNAKLFRNMPV